MRNPPASPPTGTVTFLFSDIEGSTRLVGRLGVDWPDLLERHRRDLRTAFAEHASWEQGTEGDSFFVVFASARDAVAAAAAGQRALAADDWPADAEVRVRMGLHTGEGHLSGTDYVGLDVHRAARIAAAGHGGQVVLSAATAALVKRDLLPGVRVIDLGEHRLKDLLQPERLHQLVIEGLPAEFPPLRSLSGRATNLPIALSSFVGREADIDAVRGLLATARLVTVTGPGGTGKTRLVEEVARRAAAEQRGGATFVPLEALRDAELIPVEILRAMRRDTAASTPPRDRVVEALSEEPSLLVLDNIEQLDGAASVVHDLLTTIDGLKVLASSQAALHVAGEHEYGLQPLPDGDAVRLFVDRAQAVRPDFRLDDQNRDAVEAICERLDGLPLAIELAAAQVRLLPATEILTRVTDRLDTIATRQQDLPERQRTLRATVMWSYDLLAESERTLFRRLSVFVDGATIADIEAFEGCRERAAEALDTLDTLVDRSLVAVRTVSAEAHRFAMLKTIRTVGRELLREHGEEAEALEDHAEVFRRLTALAEPELYGPNRRAWLDRLAAEHDNLRAAIDHLQTTGSLPAALEIAANIWRFWQTRGHLLEARERLQGLLAAAGDGSGVPLALLGRAEEAAGSVAYWMRTASGSEIEPHYLRSLELARASGDRDREAWALYNLSFVYDYILGSGAAAADPDRGRKVLNVALELFRAAGDRRGIGESLWALGVNSIRKRNEPDVAREQIGEAARLLAEIGDSYGASWAYTTLGMLEGDTGHPEAARTAIVAGAEIFLRDDDMTGQILAIRALGSIAARAGDDRTAARLGYAAEELARRIGVDPPTIVTMVQPIVDAMARLSEGELAQEEEAARSVEARPFLEAALAEDRISER